MHTHLSGRRRTALVVPAALAISLATAAPAVAHIDVTADGAQAGAGPITLSFSAAAESDNVGIAGVRTQLPTGIAPADVVLAAAPAGWVLVPTADGFEISGPPIEPGAAAEYSITVAELPPDTTELAFPTIQRYADGREDAWIEPEIEGAPAPQMPAPTLEVAPAAAPPEASTPAPSSAAPSSPAEATASTQPDTAGDADDEESDASTVGIVSGLVAAAVIGGGVWWWRSRRAR